MPPTPTIPAERIVVLMPNWLGDAVMATPFLRALRGLYPQAHIAATATPLVAPVLAGLPFINETHRHQKKENPVPWLRAGRFDLGILLPNSFRAAWTLFLARVPHRLGYARDRRTLLLTDTLPAMRRTPGAREAHAAMAVAQHLIDDGCYNLHAVKCLRRFHYEITVPDGSGGEKKFRITIPFPGPGSYGNAGYHAVPTIDYYVALAKYLGTENPPRTMELAVTEAERAEVDAALAPISNRQSQIENPILLVPGANFGSSKCWPAERFAALAEALADPAGPFAAQVLIATSPAERPIADAILAGVSRHKEYVHALAHFNANAGVSVGGLKEIVRRSRLMICNDTGPRHFAAAFGVPLVTLFGPTDPVWAETFSAKEVIVRVMVPCGPCQLKQCPIDHRCMKGITVETVLAAAKKLLSE